MRNQSARLYLRTGLWKSFTPDATPARKPKPLDGRHQNVRVSDETALAVLRRYMDGESLKSLAAESGISQSVIRQWSNGMRGHLMETIDRERAAIAKATQP